MQWNPYLNAVYAAAYIWIVGLGFQWLSSTVSNKPDTVFDPIAALSLLVFSVALMGFLFFYRPLILFMDGNRTEAVSYFAKTLLAFGVLTALSFIAVSVI